MPWVDLFQHMNSQPGVSITARGSYAGASYWEGVVTLDPDVRAVLQDYSCGDPYQEYLPPDGERGGVTYNNFGPGGYVSYNPPRINSIYPFNDSGFVLSPGTRVRVRARFVGDLANPEFPDDWSAEGAGRVGFVFLDTSGGGNHMPSHFAEFYSMGRDDWTEWSDHEITSEDMLPGNWSEFQGIGHETDWPDSAGPPRFGLEVEWQVFVEVELVANDDEATTNAGQAVTVDILANDTLDGEPVTLGDLAGPPTITQQPESGTAEIDEQGRLVYTPEPGFMGTVTLEYEISDEEEVCSQAEFGDYMWDTDVSVFPPWMEEGDEELILTFSNYAWREDGIYPEDFWEIQVSVEIYGPGDTYVNRTFEIGVPYPEHQQPPLIVSGYVLQANDGGLVNQSCATITLFGSAPS